MKILVTGIYRTGTTWLFNATRLMLKKSGYDLQPYFYSTNYEYRNSENAIIKCHVYYEHLHDEVDLVLTTFRPVEEIKQSMINLGTVEKQFENAAKPENILSFVDDHLRWVQQASYTMDFHTMLSNPTKILSELNDALRKRFGGRMYLDDEKISEIANELSQLKAPREGFDPTTFMTSTHPKFF